MEHSKPSDRAYAKDPKVDQMKWKAGAQADAGVKGLCNIYLVGVGVGKWVKYSFC